MSPDGVFPSSEEREIHTTYMESRMPFGRSYYKDEVLEATTDGHGNVTFAYAKGGVFTKTAKTNATNYVTYRLLAGAVNGETFNLDWDKVQSISGKTYSLRDEAKAHGLVFDGTRWIRENHTLADDDVSSPTTDNSTHDSQSTMQPLAGSPKQIAWASQIRADALRQLDLMDSDDVAARLGEYTKEDVQAVREVILRFLALPEAGRAAFIIDKRDHFHPDSIRRLVHEYARQRSRTSNGGNHNAI